MSLGHNNLMFFKCPMARSVIWLAVCAQRTSVLFCESYEVQSKAKHLGDMKRVLLPAHSCTQYCHVSIYKTSHECLICLVYSCVSNPPHSIRYLFIHQSYQRTVVRGISVSTHKIIRKTPSTRQSEMKAIALWACRMLTRQTKIQSGVITRPNVVRYQLNNYRNWDRISTICRIYKRQLVAPQLEFFSGVYLR